MLFRCVTRCFHLNQMWEPGMELEADSAPKHFLAAGGQVETQDVAADPAEAPKNPKKKPGRPPNRAKDTLAAHAPPEAKPDPVGMGDLGQ